MKTITTDIETKTVGYKSILGTKWPVEVTLYRSEQEGKRPSWFIRNVCNGICESTKKFKTLNEAQAYFGEY